MTAATAIPTLPRWTDDHKTDLELIKRYLEDHHRAAFRESRLLDPSKQQATPDDIVPTSLPEPTTTSLSNAQNVANIAFQKAFGLI